MTSNNPGHTRRQGIVYAMTDVLAMTGVYVFSKVFLQDFTFPVFGVYWFSAGLSWNLLLSLFVRDTYVKFEIKSTYILFLALIGLLDMTATIMWFEAVDKTDNPSLVSFMTNISPVYAVILGYLFLKERLSWSEAIGIVITLAGAVLIGYRSDFELSTFLFSGAGLILISSFISQGQKALLKRRIQQYHPIVLSMNRVVFLTSDN